jgi:hypothetical protein
MAHWLAQRLDIGFDRHPERGEGLMTMRRLVSLTALGLTALASEARAQSDTAAREPVSLSRRAAGGDTLIATQTRTLSTSAPQAAYSVEIPQISRVQGRAFFRTAVDISNNTTNGGVIARVQYSYTCVAGTACAGGFFRTQPSTIPLAAVDNFHSDDFVFYLNGLGLLAAGAVDGSFGTVLVTFDNLPTANGWEGTVIARNYSRVVETDPAQGTTGYSYAASLFFESAHVTLVGTLRDTSPAALGQASIQGSQRTNLGVRNTDIAGANFPGTDRTVDVNVEFFDVTAGSPTNGQRVGSILTQDDIAPGEIRQFADVFVVAQIPTNVSSVICFVDVRNPTNSTPTIEGFFNIVDNVTQDAAFFELKCADPNAQASCGRL